MTMMSRCDNMVIPLLKEKLYGRSSNHTFGIRGHIREAHQDYGTHDVVRSSGLHDVGRGLDKSSDSCYIRDIHVPDGTKQGE
jgi:hypothetical protein